jgi:D-hydroxyproline dehydrogenase subunit beta
VIVDSACDVVVIGAGMVGAACALALTRAGLSVTVLDRGPVGGGTTGAGEGNLLVSDKEPGPELDLALRSLALWRELADEFDGLIEYEPKGGVVVARDDAELSALNRFGAAQRRFGVQAEEVDPPGLRTLEPELVEGLAGGLHYPQDAQVMPSLAAAHLLRAATRAGARIHTYAEVTSIARDAAGAVSAVSTRQARISTPCVVNAAGIWGGEVAALAGSGLPVQPRRGFILVTAPLPPLIRHKVYAAAYVSDVASADAALQTSAVVEGTKAGTVLIGASRERVGLDATLSVPVLQRLAAQAIELFPILVGVHAIRSYCGFRPYLPDHLPAIGPDPHVPGLYHACGHEGAGIGLAPATGELIAQLVIGAPAAVDPRPFAPGRFDGAGIGGTPLPDTARRVLGEES